MARSPAKKKDMDPADILHLLRKAGMSYADVDRAYGLKRGSAFHAARIPHFDGEIAIAEMLSLSPRQIWPSRFDPQSGARLKPQPKANNKPKRSLRHRKSAGTSVSCGQSEDGAAA